MSGVFTQLCGEYKAKAQAFDNPPLYAHIFLRYRPLDHLKPDRSCSNRPMPWIQRTPTDCG